MYIVSFLVGGQASMWSLFLPRVGSFVLRLLRVMEPHQNRDGVEERVLIPPPTLFSVYRVDELNQAHRLIPLESIK